MMFARIDQRPIARWWWTVDRWTLGGLIALVFFGTVMSMAASPPVAERLGYDALYFTERQLGDGAVRAGDHARGLAAAAAHGPAGRVRRVRGLVRAARG